jgi:hypothetical protein
VHSLPADSHIVKLLRPRVIGEAIALPLLSLAVYLLWASQKNGHAYCDSPVPAPLGFRSCFE